MTREELLKTFPDKRIKPMDGMAVTAEVWEEAHEYHRQSQRCHALFSHGPGIFAGLEVIASDPPDRSVYIRPGIAVDPAGQTIVLPHPVAYDFGNEIEGFLYLLLSYKESRPRAAKGRHAQDGLLYVHNEFSIVARPTLPDTPTVELARLTRSSRTASLLDAQDPAHPGPNEIDLRFRSEIGTAPRKRVTVAVCYLGKATGKSHGRGAGYLARALNRMDSYLVTVDDDVPLDPSVLAYTLIYLVGGGTFEFSRSQVKGLQGYMERGGTLLIESCDPDAASTFSDYLETMGVELQALSPGHPLLFEPFLFAAPPPGFETEESPEVQVGDGVIFSTSNYGRLWHGERHDGVPSREEIRSAVEWGANLIDYALKRRHQMGHR
jgi:hypothetical protein